MDIYIYIYIYICVCVCVCVCMFPVRYEHQLRIKSKAVPSTGRGDLQGCEMLRITYCPHSRLAVVVRLSDLFAGRALNPG
jgi:hypothetical protein